MSSRLKRLALAALALLASLAAGAAALLWLDASPAPRAAAAASVTPPTPPTPPTADTVARGAYLARVGHCAGCHTGTDGLPYAGGRALATPFGSVVAGNLTPDDATGLGGWSADDFWNALHHGRSRDGRRLLPAFPFTAFTHVTRADSDALFAYLQSLAPVARAAPPHALRFPYNTALAMAAWRTLYFRPVDAAPADEAGRPADWQRGAYLVRGLGHCAACHAPRNALGATADAERLAGGAMPLQGWFAPALAPASPSEAQDVVAVVDLLRTGQNRHGTASGPMGEVVAGSTQHWQPADLRAAAVYLRSLPVQPPPPPAPAADTGRLQAGARLYAEHCADCHGRRGEGVPGIYPPLAGNPTVLLPDPGNALQLLRHGGFAPATAANPRPYSMPPAALPEQDLADLLTFIRQAWGPRASAVTVQRVMRAP